WAAMDFLRQALQRNRKILQIRDLVLLALRTLAVLLFGLALARPYFARRDGKFDDRQPLHVVVIIDNSLSMAYESLDGSLLDKAKERGRDFIDKLPAGSRITILPACGSREPANFDPYETKDDAKEALGRIEVVDRSAKLARIANEVRRACDEAPELAKRVVFIGDQQELNWRDLRQSEVFRGLPAMQVVAVGPTEWENTSIADVRVQDGLADVETPTTVVVEIAHQGRSPRRDLQVTLSVGETVVGQQTVTVEPGLGTREVSFECVFSGLTELPEPGQAVFVPLRAAITPDRLAADDERFLTVPVVAALPVVFVDQYGPDEEDVARGRLGETRHLRKLLAPKYSRSDATRQLISVRHLTPRDLSRDALADARLVVVAGAREPGEMATLLSDYVRQGGQLVLAAGAEFDPAAWNDAGWLDGRGILPLPLKPEPIGVTPEESEEQLHPFFLSFESLAGEDRFQLASVAEGDLKSLYAEPLFFKAVEVDDSSQTLEALKQAETKRIESDKRVTETPPTWLLWAANDAVEPDGELVPPDPAARARSVEARVAAHTPRVLARYELPARSAFLVSRRLGRGEVLFCSSGLLSSWNTLPKTNAVLIFDRILRGMIQNTLPERNLAPTDRLTLPLPHSEQNLTVTLARPGHSVDEPLDVSYIAAQQRGVMLSGLLTRGIYRLRGVRPAASPDRATEKHVWDLSLAVNGDPDESDLTPLARSQFDQLAPAANLSWVAPGEELNLAGDATGGQNSWWWLALTVFLLLLAEMLVLGWQTQP
ncbi:MAG TPA: VWA domain-containing protein, partial [Pirellulaceae bacterium]|nr:VWA domain-containing protein [Pirellulaceae bacterium]